MCLKKILKNGSGNTLYGVYFSAIEDDQFPWTTAQLFLRSNGNVGIGTDNPQAKLEVAGAIRLTPSSQPSNATSGMMYFDKASGVFRCFQKKPKSNQFEWVNCGGLSPWRWELEIPVIIKDSAGRVVLEINQE